jgi:4-diphosphocytidyl-2-C-methyl-D-erythritol kinase
MSAGAPESATVEIEARPKLNLCLRVLDARPDGYHEIESLAVSLTEPHDVLTVSRHVPAPGVHLVVGGDLPDVPTDESNLALRAAHALLEHAGLEADVEIVLHKRIPAGAGLGGGSADAAAALVGVRALLELRVDDASLEQIAAGIGADVAFCLREGAAWMRGRGDELEAADTPALRALVAVPPVHCATASVYAAWDDLGGPQGRTVTPPPGVAGLPELRNDLEPAAWHVCPSLVEFRDAVESECGRPAIMAGSGSAYVVLYADDETPGRAVAAVRERTGALVASAAVTPTPLVVHA